MVPSPSDLLDGQPFRDAAFVGGAVAGYLLVAGFVGYGNFVASVPGVALLVAVGYLGLRASRGVE